MADLCPSESGCINRTTSTWDDKKENPKGCHRSAKNIWRFNTHVTGDSNDNKHLICKKQIDDIYIDVGVNINTCPDGYLRITSPADCKKAMDDLCPSCIDKTTDTNDDHDLNPQGCSTKDFKWRFNTGTGNEHASKNLICQKCSTLDNANGICIKCSDANTCTKWHCNANHFDTDKEAANGCEAGCPTVDNGTCTECSDANICTKVTCNDTHFNDDCDATNGCEAEVCGYGVISSPCVCENDLRTDGWCGLNKKWFGPCPIGAITSACLCKGMLGIINNGACVFHQDLNEYEYKYDYTDAGVARNTCPGGYLPITTPEDCATAMADLCPSESGCINSTTSTLDDSAENPKGCHRSAWNIWRFNTHVTGGSNDNKHLICRIDDLGARFWSTETGQSCHLNASDTIYNFVMNPVSGVNGDPCPWNDRTTDLEVKPNCKVDAYGNGGGAGWKVTLEAGKYSVPNNDFQKGLSSASVSCAVGICRDHDADYSAEDKPGSVNDWELHIGLGWRSCDGPFDKAGCASLCSELPNCTHYSWSSYCCFPFKEVGCEIGTNTWPHFGHVMAGGRR